MLQRAAQAISGVVGICAMLLFLGFGIGSSEIMPGYAPVYLDDQAKTYIALPCLEEWQSRKSDAVAVLRLSKAVEAYNDGYSPDDDCRNTGAFAPDGRSMSGMFLMKIGLLGPKTQWWDMPYRDESGKVVYPKPAPAD
jgi:hypothetical protein